MNDRLFRMLPVLLAILLLVIAGCEAEDDEEDSAGKTRFLFNLEQDASFFETPFPTDLRLEPGGTIHVSDYPNPFNVEMVDKYLSVGEQDVRGWGTNSGIFFSFTRPLDPETLPEDAGASLESDSAVFVFNVDPDSAGYGERHPVRVVFKPDHGIYTPDNLLCILPVQGVPLRPLTRYAAVVTDRVRDASGKDLVPPKHFRALRNGDVPDAPRGEDAYRVYFPLWEALEDLGIETDRVAAATVFTTQDPTGEMAALRDSVYAMMPFAVSPDSVVVLNENEDFTLLEGRFPIPIFQSGTPPYLFEGGRIFFDAGGAPVLQDTAEVRLALSVPTGQMPTEGWPYAIHSHGSGGDYRTFVRNDMALWMARRGIAMASMDAPHHGERNTVYDSGGLESLFFYNVLNPYAFRDNARQAAVEQMALQNAIGTLAIEQETAPGSDASASVDGMIRFDPDNALFIGHSQGSTVGPLFVGTDPLVRAAVFSGAGGSLLWTSLTKTSPTDVPQILRTALLIPEDSEELDEFHPLLSLLQAMAESAEPMNYGRHFHAWGLEGSPAKHVFQIVGITDTYVASVSQHAALAAAGMDLIAPVLDEDALIRTQYTGGARIDAPVEGNRSSWAGEPVTAAAIQFPDPEGDTDGHYVTYHFPEAQYMLSCFLRSAVDRDVPVIPEPVEDFDAPCQFP